MSHSRPSRSRVRLASAIAVVALTSTGAVVAGTSPAHATTACPATMAVATNTGGIGLWTNCATVLTQVTSPPAGTDDYNPAISPDGTKLSFTRHNFDTTANDIIVKPLAGGAETLVMHITDVNMTGNLATSAWSPNSSQLAVSTANLGPGWHGNIYKADPAGGGSTLLSSSLALTDVGIAWCGSRLFVPVAGYLASINAADGSGETRVTAENVAVSNPACTPDSRYVMYSGVGADPVQHIYTVRASGGTSVQLTTGGPDMQPSTSGDWTMAYMHWEPNSDLGYLRFMSLADGHVVSGPTNPPTGNPAFALGNGSIPAPPAFPIAVGSSPTPTCPVGELIGVRGSGETESDFGGLGRTVTTVANTFASKIPLIKIDHIDYPAVPVGYQGADYSWQYDKSVDTGRIVLKTKIKQFLRQCPGKYLVLVGYSQGAHVVGDVLGELTAAERKWIAAVILLGDPRFNHKQKHGVNVGNFNSFDGVYSIKQKPRDINGSDVDRVRSVCIGGDPVCNSWPPNIAACLANLPTGLCPHLQYVESGWADKAGLWAANRFISLN